MTEAPVPQGPARHRPIRVVVADDSASMCALLVALLEGSATMQVVGVAGDGAEAVRLTARLRPDVVTLDLRMPQLDGLEATRRIMRECPTPIVIVSGSLQRGDVDLTIAALQAGALSVVRKPAVADPDGCHELLQIVRLMAGVPVVHHWQRPAPARAAARPPAGPRPEIVGIAASTGGPPVLASVLRALPADFPMPLLVVQHVADGFTAGLVDWLAGQTALAVRPAEQGRVLRPGEVLVAPDGLHLEVSRRGLVHLSAAPPYRGLRPSANYLFASLALAYGARALGVILSGMGDDGADGLAMLHRSGGRTVAQAAGSCAVDGMPQEAVRRGVIDAELPVDAIAATLIELSRVR
jgi:two-component system chemotaxis response regulator CheB